MKLTDKIMVWFMFGCCLFFYSAIWYGHITHQQEIKKYVELESYVKSNMISYYWWDKSVTGQCVGKDYMMIYTKGRTYSEIMETFIHEYAHCKQGLRD